MNKFYKKLIALTCVLLCIFSVSGCSMILDIEDNTTSNYTGFTTQVTVDIKLDKNFIFSDTYNYEGQPLTSNATFKSNGVTEDFDKYEDAAPLVNRSVVKLIMQDETGKDSSYGSGVIVDIEGGLNSDEYYLLTCHHVIANGGNVSVCVPDENGRNIGDNNYNQNYIFKGYIGGQKGINPFQPKEVTLVGGDRDSDIAVLKLNALGKSVGQLQKSSFPQTENYLENGLRYAQDVFAIGNPSGDLPMTFLGGNISYLDRDVAFDSIGYMSLIQHDCMITHGSSGGGLFNMKGQLIGITNGGNDTYKGMNYAIPYYGKDGFMNVAEKIIESQTTTNYGYVEGRWNLGVTIKEAEQKVNGSLVTIVSVDEMGNAHELLKKDDYILKVEFTIGETKHSEEVTSLNTFKKAIFTAREGLTIGDSVTVTVARPTPFGLI